MMKSKIVQSLISLLICVAAVSSQSMLGAQYPLGIPLRSGTGPSLSLGGAGTGVINDYYGMSENPANLGAMNRALFSGLLALQYLQIKDQDLSSAHMAFQPKSFFFAFPLAGYGALGLGMNQLSETDLKYNRQETIVVDNMTLGSPRGLVINGGAVGWQIGYGLTLYKKLRLGLTYERMYHRNATTTFKMIGGTLSDSLIDSTGLLISANGISGGIMYSIDKLTLGFSAKAYSKANAEFHFQTRGTQRYLDTTYKVNTVDPTKTDTTITANERVLSSNSTGKVKLPPSLSLGISYQLKPEWLLAADLDITMWEKFHSDRPLQAENRSALSNAVSFALGTQYIPAPNLLTPKYYEIIQYRAGWRMSRLPGADAFETALSLGTGLPLRKGGGIFDLFFEAGRRWDKRYSQYSENFFSFQIGVNGGQKWFQTTDEGY